MLETILELDKNFGSCAIWPHARISFCPVPLQGAHTLIIFLFVAHMKVLK